MGKPTGFVPGAKYSGHNGQVLVTDLEVTITREGFGGRMSGTPTIVLGRGQVEIEHKTASRLVNGWVRITEPRTGPRPRFEYQDANLVLYTWQQRDAFEDLVRLLS
jgi:hypothetical protein